MSVTAVPLQPLKRSYITWLALGVLVAIAAAAGLAFLGTAQAVAIKGSNEQFLSWNKSRSGVHATGSGLQYQVLKAGTGPNATDGDGVAVTIVGTLRDGTEFQPRAPMRIIVGQDQMIPGFTEALKQMNSGAHYRFWLPPQIAYGSSAGAPPELKDQVLIFDISMDQHISAAQLRQLQMQQQMMQQMQGGGAPAGAGEAAPQH